MISPCELGPPQSEAASFCRGLPAFDRRSFSRNSWNIAVSLNSSDSIQPTARKPLNAARATSPSLVTPNAGIGWAQRERSSNLIANSSLEFLVGQQRQSRLIKCKMDDAQPKHDDAIENN
jgi:hypothetical protein